MLLLLIDQAKGKGDTYHNSFSFFFQSCGSRCSNRDFLGDHLTLFWLGSALALVSLVFIIMTTCTWRSTFVAEREEYNFFVERSHRISTTKFSDLGSTHGGATAVVWSCIVYVYVCVCIRVCAVYVYVCIRHSNGTQLSASHLLHLKPARSLLDPYTG